MFKQWEGFKEGVWQNGIDVRNFIQKNYTAYEGDKSFLEGTTKRTDAVLAKVNYRRNRKRHYRCCYR